MEILGTHHIGVRTANFAAMRDFYENTLGLPFVGGFPGRNTIFLSAGGTTIELIETTGEFTPPQMGLHHVAFEIADIDAAHAELVEQGVVFHIPPRAFPPDAPLVRLAFFKDPDGNDVELFQPIGNKYPQQ
jgi:catechol 2,3-dioxygenase-like lactoylglutathione lyase family enzyme